MPNGKAGDHWLTDLLAHDISQFEDVEIDEMVRTLVKLGAVEQLEEIVNDILSRQNDMPSQVLRRPEVQRELRSRLGPLIEETSREREERGWET